MERDELGADKTGCRNSGLIVLAELVTNVHKAGMVKSLQNASVRLTAFRHCYPRKRAGRSWSPTGSGSWG